MKWLSCGISIQKSYNKCMCVCEIVLSDRNISEGYWQEKLQEIKETSSRLISENYA